MAIAVQNVASDPKATCGNSAPSSVLASASTMLGVNSRGATCSDASSFYYRVVLPLG
jgi:hypothetical protein